MTFYDEKSVGVGFSPHLCVVCVEKIQFICFDDFLFSLEGVRKKGAVQTTTSSPSSLPRWCVVLPLIVASTLMS